MFDSLTGALGSFFNRIQGKGRKLTEADVKEGLRGIRMALLEADVALPVVTDFMAKVSVKAVGVEVLTALQPAHQLVKIVHDELIVLMGPVNSRINFKPAGITIILMAGLQGSGKTTTCGKLAMYLKNKGRRPLLVAADLQRPAAVQQLQVLGETIEVPVFTLPGSTPSEVCGRSLEFARANGRDTIILDTAGRLQIDEPLMREVAEIQAITLPDEVFLVVDSLVGQDAINSAKVFNERLPITGVILTKLDGDSRGGAALSVKHITGKPIKFVGVSEKLNGLEEFHPERMATRILGMGDIITLAEKAQEALDQDKAKAFQDKMLANRLSLDDFLEQMRAIKKMGSFKDLLGMIPGFASLKELDSSDDQFARVEAIICSMTKEERKRPEIIDAGRRKRIAKGSGADPVDVGRLLKEFEKICGMLSNVGKASKFVNAMVPNAAPAARSLSEDERKAIRKRRKLEKNNKKKNRRA